MKRECSGPTCAGWGHYLRSSSRTPNASASLWAVRGDAIRRNSSKFEIESAETPLLAESCWRVIRRSSRTLFRLCSSGMRHAYPFCACPERLTPRLTREGSYRGRAECRPGVSVTYAHSQEQPTPGTKKRTATAARMACKGLEAALEALGSGQVTWGGFGTDTRISRDTIIADRKETTWPQIQ